MMAKTIGVKIDWTQINNVRQSLKDNPIRMRKVVAGAINDTAKHATVEMSKLIRQVVNIQKKDIDKYIKRTYATADKMSAVVTLAESPRLPLKYFGAKQTKTGVTYRILKGMPSKSVKHAFGPNIPRLGGNVFTRIGKKRLPIRKLYGVSPWGIFVKQNMYPVARQDAEQYLQNRLEHRLQYQQ